MQLTITLPERSTVLASNRERWAEVLADPQWRDHPYRIETNEHGRIIMTPPAGGFHSKRQGKITAMLDRLLGDHVLTECPISTAGGVRAADVAWSSEQRYKTIRGQIAFETAPEICVEVFSPDNTAAEMQTKRQLYFDAGAKECWICDTEGRMSYYHAADPNTSTTKSTLCPNFPKQIED